MGNGQSTNSKDEVVKDSERSIAEKDDCEMTVKDKISFSDSAFAFFITADSPKLSKSSFVVDDVTTQQDNNKGLEGSSYPESRMRIIPTFSTTESNNGNETFYNTHGENDEKTEEIGYDFYDDDNDSDTTQNNNNDFYQNDNENDYNSFLCSPYSKNNRNSQSSPALNTYGNPKLRFTSCLSLSDSHSKSDNKNHSDNESSIKEDISIGKKLQNCQNMSCSSPTSTFHPMMNHMNSIGSFGNLIGYNSQMEYTDEEILMVNGDLPTEASNLRPKIEKSPNSNGKDEWVAKCRSFHIVTTAALPWMTGTAVNPLLRAAYLNKMNREAVKEAVLKNREDDHFESKDHDSLHDDTLSDMGTVTLVIPWLIDKSDRKGLYGNINFNTPSDQELYIRQWLRETANLAEEADEKKNGIKISFYPARYHNFQCSIFAMGDICSLIDDKDADVCIMEEPEHLNWFRPVDTNSWPQKFNFVVGIIHTNYKAYAREQIFGMVVSSALGSLSSIMVRAYCHKIIKLSGTLQTFASEKEVVSNTHGIRSEFLDEGKRRGDSIRAMMRNHSSTDPAMNSVTPNGVYFIGKLLWAKGLDRLIELEELYKKLTGNFFEIQIFGSGPDEVEIQKAFRGRRRGKSHNEKDGNEQKEKETKLDILKNRHEWRRSSIPATFPGRVDHAALREKQKIFVNPSITEVLCTTTAEALAMGKFVIIPSHPSNEFFEQFPNCLMYHSKMDFVSRLRHAFEFEPTPLSAEHEHKLTWDAGTQRLMDASIITRRDAERRERIGGTKSDERAAKFLRDNLSGPKGDFVRTYFFGGGRKFGEQFQYSLKASKSSNDIERVLS